MKVDEGFHQLESVFGNKRLHFKEEYKTTNEGVFTSGSFKKK